MFIKGLFIIAAIFSNGAQAHNMPSNSRLLLGKSGPYKAARDAYVAATATYTKSLYE